MRIAHLSDLHLSPDHFPERTDALYEILDHCSKLRVDHVVITGDITNQGKSNEFIHARNVFKEFGLLDPQKLTVTIGNHDIFGGPYYAEDVLAFPGVCRQTDYDAKVKEFTTAFRETFDGSKYVSSSSIFPFVKIVRDVAFVAINSVAPWSSMRNPLGSNGEVSKKVVRQLEEWLSSTLLKGKTIIVVIHHHFHKLEKGSSSGGLARLWHAIESSTMKLRKKKRLFRLFKKTSVDLVLHGHVHRHEKHERKNIRFVNAGGTILAQSAEGSRFHLLDVRKSTIKQTDISMAPRMGKIQKVLTG